MSEKSLRKFCYVACVLTLAAMFYINGCHESSPTHPTEAGSEEGGLALKIFADPETRAKLTGLTLDVVGLNDAGQPAEPRMSINVPSLNLPVTVPLTLYDPPCRYQVTVTAALSREAPRVATRVLDVCSESRLTIKIDTFEGFFIAVNPLKAPEAVNAGAAADVSCGTNQIDAPDKAQYPLSATLSEQDSSAISGAFDVNVAVAGSFPDPYPLSSPVTERHFTCEITDGRSAPQVYTLTVKRIPITPIPIITVEPPVPPADQPVPPVDLPVPGVTNLTIALAASPSVPFGTNETPLTITLTDSAGNPWGKPVAVEVTMNPNNAQISTPSPVTITDGSETVTLSYDGSLPRPQNVTVSAQVTSAGYTSNTANANVTFAGVVPPKNLTVTLTPSLTSVPFGTNSTTITVAVSDSGGVPITVLLTHSGGKLSASTLDIPSGGSKTVTLSEDGTLLDLTTAPVNVTVYAEVKSTGYTGRSPDTTVTFQEVPETKTLYRLFSWNPNDYAWTDYMDSNYKSELTGTPKYYGIYQCTLGQVFIDEIPGVTTPLYRYYRTHTGGAGDTSVKNDSMTTDVKNERITDGSDQDERPLGHILIKDIPGRTKSLYRRLRNYTYNGKPAIDYMTTLDDAEVAPEPSNTGWSSDRGLGYIVPPSLGSCACGNVTCYEYP